MEYRKTINRNDKRQTDKMYTDGAAGRPVVTVDYEKYAHFLEDADLTEDQKRAFLNTLWGIIISFIDLGFGVHPAQRSQNPCGQLAENLPLSAPMAANGVKYPDSLLIEQFEEAAEREAELVAGDSE